MKSFLNRYTLLFIGLLIFFILLPNSPLFRNALEEDSGMFLYHGQQILQGRIPYRDVWEHKGPVILYINALGLEIGGGSRWGVWFLEFLTIFGSSMLGFIILKRIFGILPALFSSILWIISLIFVLDGGNLTEEYNIFLQFFAIFLFYKSELKKSYNWRGFLIGILGGLSFFLKQNLIGFFVSILFYIFITRVLKKHFSELIREWGTIFIGFFTTIGLIFLYFTANQALGLMLDSIFRFNLIYSSSTILSKLRAITMGFWIFARSGLTFVVLTGFIVSIISFFHPFTKQKKSFLVGFAIIWFIIEIIFVGIPGINPPHYFMVWLPVSAVFIAYFFYIIQQDQEVTLRIKNNIPKRNLNLTNLTVLTLILVMSLPPLGILAYQYFPEKNSVICKDLNWFLLPGSAYFQCTNTKEKVTQYILSNTKKTDYVLMWGFGGSVNFSSDRVSPSRFTYQYPLFLKNYHSEIFAKEFVKDIIAHKPKIIIDTTPTVYLVPPIDPLKRKAWSSKSMSSEAKVILEYINAHYRFVGTLGQDQWLIYKHNKYE